MNKINTWEDLMNDIEDLFNNPEARYNETYKTKEVYPSLIEIVKELKENTQFYIDHPKNLHDFIFDNEQHKSQLLNWLPYLSGACAQLVEMKFYDLNKQEITDKKIISDIVRLEDKELQSTVLVSIEPQIETLKKYSFPNEKSKKIKLN